MQIVCALVKRADHCRPAGQSVGKWALQVRTFGLGREHLAGMGVEDCYAAARKLEGTAFALRDLRDIPD